MTTISEICDRIRRTFPDAVLDVVADGSHPHVRVKPEGLMAVCDFLKNDPATRFDLLRCVTAIDWMEKSEIELSYDVLSLGSGHALAVKVTLDRAAARVPSVAGVWPAAEWHERESYDLMGVHFTDHPDLTRILMPEDWIGHPLRKDYQDPVAYHGRKINP